jgi:hypothetical protein
MSARCFSSGGSREATSIESECSGIRKAAEALRAQLLEHFNRVIELATAPGVRWLIRAMCCLIPASLTCAPRHGRSWPSFQVSFWLISGLDLEIEGHTDSTGSDDLNQTLSQQRGDAVRGYLVEQGLSDGKVTAQGFGKTMPIADNETAAGRQKNRRVEIIVSGEVIGQRSASSRNPNSEPGLEDHLQRELCRARAAHSVQCALPVEGGAALIDVC